MRLLSIALATVALTSVAHPRGRVSDKDLENLIRNLRDDAKSFRPVFEAALHKSTIRKTSQEKDAKNLAVRFEKQTDALLNTFKQTKKGTAELGAAGSSAQQIDSLVRTVHLGSRTNSRWAKIQTELEQVSNAFGIQSSHSGDNPRGMTPYPQNASAANAPTCLQAVGPSRSKRLVQDCLAVSPATHPPCNAQNSCALIIDEIKRSCSLESQTAPPLCSEYK